VEIKRKLRHGLGIYELVVNSFPLLAIKKVERYNTREMDSMSPVMLCSKESTTVLIGYE
jgi:hypothetical protein